MIVFFIGYNCLPPTVKTYVLIGVLVVAIAVGFGAAKLASKFIEKFLMPIVGAAGCVAGMLVLCGVFHINNKYAKAGAIFFGILFGAFVGLKLGKLVRTAGTAFIGAF